MFCFCKNNKRHHHHKHALLTERKREGGKAAGRGGGGREGDRRRGGIDLPLSVFANGSHGDRHRSIRSVEWRIHTPIHGVDRRIYCVDLHIDRRALIGLPRGR
jgi:hypothetical protein